MSALSVDRAIRRRFSEVYKLVPGLRVLENDPFPEMTNTSFLVGDGEGGSCSPLALQYPRGGSSFDRVLVFLENEEGHVRDIRHHVSFQNVRSRWREEEGATGRDRICFGTTTAVLPNGQVIYGPDMILERPQAQPESLYYDFHVVSSNYTFSQEILQTVRDLFPALGSIDVEFRDGSVEPIDMILRVNAFRSSPFDATLEPGDSGLRRYRWTMQYEVESYSDNTLQGEYKQTITQACAPTSVKSSTS